MHKKTTKIAVTRLCEILEEHASEPITIAQALIMLGRRIEVSVGAYITDEALSGIIADGVETLKMKVKVSAEVCRTKW